MDHNSVTVEWTKNGLPQSNFKLARIGTTSNYADVFNTPSGSVVPGDVIAYYITASDVSVAGNTGRSPASGEHTFTVSSALGLVLDSDPRRVTKTGSAQTSDPASDPAADPEDDPAQPDAAQQD